MMDVTTVAIMLGVSARPPVDEAAAAEAGPKPPSWWPGGDQAADQNIEAARQLGFIVGSVN